MPDTIACAIDPGAWAGAFAALGPVYGTIFGVIAALLVLQVFVIARVQVAAVRVPALLGSMILQFAACAVALAVTVIHLAQGGTP